MKSTGQNESLFDPDPGHKGRVSKAVEADISTMSEDDLKGKATIAALARSLAYAADLAHIRGNEFAATAVARELRETMAALNPPDKDHDAIGALIEDILRTPLGDSTDA